MSGGTHLELEERERLAALKAEGLSLRAIARALGRAASTVSRERRRNALPKGGYLPVHAEGCYLERRQRPAVLERDAKLGRFVRERLLEGWRRRRPRPSPRRRRPGPGPWPPRCHSAAAARRRPPRASAPPRAAPPPPASRSRAGPPRPRSRPGRRPRPGRGCSDGARSYTSPAPPAARGQGPTRATAVEW